MTRSELMVAALLVTLVPLAPVWGADEEKESDTCALCHEQETKEWTDSPHAHTINSRFLAEWDQEGEKWECLVCHTSQYDRKTGTFSHAGVSCQSCHGPATADHPDKVKKLLPVTAETCQSCHSITYGEWRISRHGQKNIRCFDCHKMHEMKLRKDDPDQMCGTCHTERLKDYSHATHHVKGVKCIDCHMPEVMNAGLKIKGTGARGHAFSVGAETCAICHKEMVHSRSDIAVLESEVQRLKEMTPETLQKQVTDERKENDQLRAAVRANRRVFSVIVVVAFCLGVAIEYAVVHRRSRKPTREGLSK
ncbi:MAG: multiheme c-type cytochrome [Verrucomicrobiia bacterium]